MDFGEVHTVFSTECTSFYDWQAAGVFYSHAQVLQPGYVTRLMACDHPQGYAGSNIGPTHVHPNFASHKNNHVHDHYSPYNKPFSLHHWLYNNPEPPRSEYVLIVEPDTVFRKPVDCHRDLGVRRGVAASFPYPYLEGADNGMAAQFVSDEATARVDKVGGFICMHIDDLRKVVPRWINLTITMRKHPERYWQIDGVGTDYPTGDSYVQRGHAPYISDMYGYIFAAAEVGIRHSIREDMLLTPGYPPMYEPTLLRYDQWCKFGEKNFNKLSYKSGFSVQNCKQYFPKPPDLQLLDTSDLQVLGTELVCVEQVAVLNEALCEYHQRMCCKFTPVTFGCNGMRAWRHGPMTAEGCEKSCCDRGGQCSHFVFDEAAADGPCLHSTKRFRAGECAEGSYPLTGKAVAGRKEVMELTCPGPAWEDVQRMQEQHNVLGGAPECLDTEPLCQDWESRGECISNERYMRRVCPSTCRVEGCWDRHFNCATWAEQGECEENFQYMVETCPVVCRERRAEVARQRAQEDLNRLQMLEEARGEQKLADAAAEAALAEEEEDDEQEVHTARKEEEKEEYRPARAVAIPEREPDPDEEAKPRATPKEGSPPSDEELEIAWGRVALAVAAVPLGCFGLLRMCARRASRRQVFVTKKV